MVRSINCNNNNAWIYDNNNDNNNARPFSKTVQFSYLWSHYSDVVIFLISFSISYEYHL